VRTRDIDLALKLLIFARALGITNPGEAAHFLASGAKRIHTQNGYTSGFLEVEGQRLEVIKHRSQAVASHFVETLLERLNAPEGGEWLLFAQVEIERKKP
jgi:hypothetical protein